MECRAMIISWVLIDNVCFECLSVMTLSRIGVEDCMMHPTRMMVHAFDGNKTSTYGKIDL